MTKLLTIGERLAVCEHLLPVVGTKAEMQLARSIREKTQLTADEKTAAGLKYDELGTLVWTAIGKKSIDYTDSEIALLQQRAARKAATNRVKAGELPALEAFSSE